MLRFMGSQRVGHDWATELNWTEQFIGNTGDKKHVKKKHHRWKQHNLEYGKLYRRNYPAEKKEIFRWEET